MKNLRHKLGLLCGLVALASSSNALAVDSKIIPGTACEYYGKQNADAFFTMTGVTQLTNSNSSSRYAVCPIVRDDMQETVEFCNIFGANCETFTFPSHIEYAEMNVSGNVRCDLWMRPKTGGAAGLWNRDDVYTPFGSAGRKYTWFSGSTYATADIGASLTFYCEVPPGGAILNYRVDEGEP